MCEFLQSVYEIKQILWFEFLFFTLEMYEDQSSDQDRV